MKVIAVTTGLFMFQLSAFESVERLPHVVTYTDFLENKVFKREVKLLKSNLPEEATDKEFQEFLKDSPTQELAIESFMSKYSEVEPPKDEVWVNPETVVEPEPAPVPEPVPEPAPTSKAKK